MLSVLHADGDRELSEIHADFLASRGFQVHTAAGGVDCVEKLRHVAPDLLILDLELPWGGGDGVLAVMREDRQLRQIPVVMTSAVSSVQTLEELTSPPVVSAMAKPFKVSALLERLVKPQEIAVRLDEHRLRDSMSEAAPLTDEFVVNLEREIHLRTGRQVQDLLVKRVGGALLVHGHVRSFHVKQLVLVAAMKCRAGRGVEIQFDVEVE